MENYYVDAIFVPIGTVILYMWWDWGYGTEVLFVETCWVYDVSCSPTQLFWERRLCGQLLQCFAEIVESWVRNPSVPNQSYGRWKTLDQSVSARRSQSERSTSCRGNQLLPKSKRRQSPLDLIGLSGVRCECQTLACWCAMQIQTTTRTITGHYPQQLESVNSRLQADWLWQPRNSNLIDHQLSPKRILPCPKQTRCHFSRVPTQRFLSTRCTLYDDGKSNNSWPALELGILTEWASVLFVTVYESSRWS